MLFFKLNNRKQDENSDAGSAGTGDNAAANANTDQSNDQNISDPLASLWDTNSNDQQTQQQNPNQQQQTQQQQQAAPNTNEAFSSHVESLGLSSGIDVGKIQSDLAEGNGESLQQAFNDISAKTYQAAMVNMNEVVNAKVSAAVQQAVEQSGNELTGSMATRELNSALPFTADPTFKPIADNVFAQLVSKGNSVQKAIELTGEYFKKLHTSSSKDLGITPQRNNSGRGGFQGSNMQVDVADNGDNSPDWMDFLT